MTNVATLRFVTTKNCLGLISSSLLRNVNQSQQVQTLRVSSGDRIAYVSVTPLTTSDIGTNWLCMNGIYAAKLGFTDGCCVVVEPVEPLGCVQAWIEPLSVDDWEILELHAGLVESQALDQIRVLWPGQVFPIWVDNNICIYLKTVAVEPNAHCSLLMPLTELIVQPKINRLQNNGYATVKNSSSCIDIPADVAEANSTYNQEIHELTERNFVERSKAFIYLVSIKPFKHLYYFLRFIMLFFWHQVPQILSRLRMLLYPFLKRRKSGASIEPQKDWIDAHISSLPNNFSVVARVEPVLFEQVNFELSSRFLLNQPNTVFLHSTSHLKNCQPDVYLVLLSKYLSPSEKFLEYRNRKVKANSDSNKSSKEDDSKLCLDKCVVRMYLHPHTKHAMVNNWTLVCDSHRLKVPSCVRRQLNLSVSSKVCLQKLTDLPLTCVDVRSISFNVKFASKIAATDLSSLAIDSFKDWLSGISDRGNPVPISVGVLFIFSMTINQSEPEYSEPTEIAVEAVVAKIETKNEKVDVEESKEEKTYLLSSDDFSHVEIHFSESKGNTFLPSQAEVDLQIPDESVLVYCRGLEAEVKALERFVELALSSRPLSGALTEGGTLLRQTCALVTGAKGTGKSVLCRAILNKYASDSNLHAYVHIVSCSQWRGKKPESVKRACDELLYELLWRQPAVLLLDDLDQLIPAAFNNDDQSTPDSLYTLQLVSVMKRFLQALAGRALEAWEATPKVAVLVTAKSNSSLHPSSTNSGAHLFGNTVRIELPNRGKREIILKAMIENFTEYRCPGDLRDVAERAEGFAAGDLLSLVRKSSHLFQQRKFSNDTSNPDSTDNLLHTEMLLSALRDFTPASLQNAKLHKPLPLSWKDVGGLTSVKQKLQEQLLWPVKYRHLFTECGLEPQSGILLFGPPGCGKTLVAGVVASECGLNFISIKGPEVLSKYIGASEAAVRDLFARARAASPCILFFDEFDSLAPKRGHDSTGVTDRVVNQLLTHLDGVEPLVGVTVMAASSRPDLLDPALLRPGRLDNLLYCPFPDLAERAEVLRSLSGRLPLSADVDLLELARDCENFSGADLKALLYNAQLEAVHETIGKSNSPSSSLSNGSMSFLSIPSNDGAYQGNGHPQVVEDEGDELSTNAIHDLTFTADELIQPMDYASCHRNALPGNDANNRKKSSDSHASDQQSSNVVYFTTLCHGRSDHIPQHILELSSSVLDRAGASHSAPSSCQDRTERLVITGQHIERALELTRPSVTAVEREKFELMYSKFLRSRERAVASQTNYYGGEQRTTLS